MRLYLDLPRMEFWQRCTDPDCRAFESERFALPLFAFDTEAERKLWTWEPGT